MNIVFRLLAVCFVVCMAARGAGVPYNAETGKLDCPHTILDLSAEQQEEYEILGTLTLTSEQWKSLRKVSPATPKRITEIYPVNYNDCTCDSENYAVILSKSRIAIIHDSIEVEKTGWHMHAEDRTTLTVDRRGQFYRQGTLIPFPKLLQLIAYKREGVPQREKALSLSFPYGMKRSDEVVKSRIDELFRVATKAGWSLLEDAPE